MIWVMLVFVSFIVGWLIRVIFKFMFILMCVDFMFLLSR